MLIKWNRVKVQIKGPKQIFVCMHKSKIKLNFGGFMTFGSTFKALKTDNFSFSLLQLSSFDR